MASQTQIKKEIIEISFPGRGTVIGEEDALRDGKHQTSCICIQQPEDDEPAEIMKISKEKLIKLLRGQNTDKEIKEQIKAKGNKLTYGINLRNKVKLKMRKLSKMKTLPEPEL